VVFAHGQKPVIGLCCPKVVSLQNILKNRVSHLNLSETGHAFLEEE
jgi:hypothetical protein